jgi:hypothetical protein
MPFDNLPQSTPDTAIWRFYDRREAAAALWRKIPESQFDMRTWRSEDGCVACALGWLAIKQHDGWYYSQGKLPMNGPPIEPSSYITRIMEVYSRAARYFALSIDDAIRCFWGDISFHPQTRTLPDDVATTLLTLPYVRHIEGIDDHAV